MKRMIDIDKHIIEHLKDGSFGVRPYDRNDLIDAVMNGVSFPEHPTNEDVIKAMFPDFRQTDHFELTETCEIVYLRNGEEICEIRCSKEWLNAPYDTESEEQK